MHFWIDKRSQTCGFSGRHRVPSSISTGGFGHRHRGHRSAFGASPLGLGFCSTSTARNYNCPTQAHIKLMVTPVHRFQSIECVAGNTSRYHHAHHGGRSSHHHPHHVRQSLNSNTGSHHLSSPSTYSNNAVANRSSDGNILNHGSTNGMDLDNTGVYLELPLDHHQRNSSTSSPLADQHHHHSMLHSNPNMLPGTAGKLKCGMWASFAIVTIFMVGAKFYFNNQSTGMEVLIFCSLLVVVLFAGCTVSLCEAVTTSPNAPTVPIPSSMIMDTANGPAASTTTGPGGPSTSSIEDLQQHLPTPMIHDSTDDPPLHPPPAQPPPPYHIAVLLPQHQPANSDRQHIIIVDDSPPPSYDKAVS